MPSLSGFALIIQLLDIMTITTSTVAIKLPNRNFISSQYQNDTNMFHEYFTHATDSLLHSMYFLENDSSR